MEPIERYTPEPQPPRPPRRVAAWWPYALAALVIVAGVVAYLLLARDRSRPQPPAPVAATPPAPPEAGPEPAIETPPLGGSDDWLRGMASALSSHPELARWLVSEDLVRRFTAAVDNVARGESPRPHLGFMEPEGEFTVERRDGALYAADDSHLRYAAVAEVIGSIDAAGAAELYRRLRPLLEESYAELGYPGERFEETLAAAIAHLRATELPVSAPRLAAGVDSYTYRRPELEGLSGAQKHLLRMGPDNAAVVQAKLGEIAVLLGLADS